MKKIVCLLIVVCLLALSFSFLTSCTSRSDTLRVLTQGEYLSKDVIKAFQNWYKKETGKKVVVKNVEVETIEEMYTLIKVKKDDFDLICPSDYMVERMRKENLLKPFSSETAAILNEVINPDIIAKAKESYDPTFSYTMPYMMGTLGIMYNVTSSAAQANAAQFASWASMWSNANSKKIFMKDSERDAYTIGLLYAFREELKAASLNYTDYTTPEYQALLTRIFSEGSDELIAKAKKALSDQKALVYDYEVDSGKDDMVLDGGKKGYFGLFWSCDAGYVINEGSAAAKKLCYLVPQEGGNLWIDSFCIPKTVKNESKANKFVQFLCKQDVAYDCMDYVGSTTGVKAAAEKYMEDILEDDEFLNGTYEGFVEMYKEMMLPSAATLTRCAVMRDLGSYNDKITSMWATVLSN